MKRYGRVFYYRVLHMHRIVITDADAIKHVMVSKAKNYPRSPLVRTLFKVLNQAVLYIPTVEKKLGGGDTLVTTEGSAHAALRKLFNPHFGQANVKTMLHVFQHHTDVFMEQLAIDQPLDLKNRTRQRGPHPFSCDLVFTQVALDMIGVAAFGYDFESLRNKNPREIQAFHDNNLTPSLFGVIGFALVPFYEYLPLASNRRRAEAQSVLQSLIDRVLQQKLIALETSTAGSAPKDILDLILAQASDMPMADIRALLLMFMFAGHETTDNTLAWVVSFVAQHPTVAAKVHDECLRMRCDGNDKVPTWEQLGHLSYLSAVIHETLRLRPTVPETSRHAAEADTLPLGDGSSVGIPKGADIFLDIIAIHRNPTYWSQPNEFLPERFIEGTDVYEADLALRGGKPNTFCYFPFSVGDKNCIGSRFAMAEMLVVLSTLFSTYSVALTPAANLNVRKDTVAIAPVYLEVTLSPLPTRAPFV
ncbi:hypothetical protein SPRG_02370 [Saprolegnia parasitica CBS 223.65]|uniref:Cytochrome P450 n=1 Tax=Saprolegnia parasitica (strain CBS 223.65) TaxID=695850 RepID=A0A067CPR8_SAPPC|nr:hypothetical protein SPRG_02370 [Saprolegnia parasitica CBS 223.65]KDO32669.1 hypothetical protein SPRG_02370 [Saprolegnia parasitica CBS 223.65]|eukprot:XP_012196336.1 hypothetical protein SPRG_02370 [Saprolegnia parasitica CBS 223.65]